MTAARTLFSRLLGAAQPDWKRSDRPEVVMHPRIVAGGPRDVMQLDIYHYDFAALARAEEAVAGLDRREILIGLFKQLTAGQGSEPGKWFCVLDYLGSAMRHPPLTQPMYSDRTMVTDPMVLLQLQEGRCGHIARLVADIALANGYPARIVQLATHVVAEVQWDDRWHALDANGGYPAAQMQEVFPTLPGVVELSTRAADLDRLAARGWQWDASAYRALNGSHLGYAAWFPGTLLTSSQYFGREVFEERFFGDQANPRGPRAIYSYKNHGAAQWQADRYYGWNDLRVESEVVRAVPVRYAVIPPKLVVPQIVFTGARPAIVPIRFLPAQRPIGDPVNVFRCTLESKFSYEIRVSSSSRGWDYGYRNYTCMPRSGAADTAVIRDPVECGGGMLGADWLAPEAGTYYVEVLALDAGARESGEFVWPSNEMAARVFSSDFRPWNDGVSR